MEGKLNGELKDPEDVSRRRRRRGTGVETSAFSLPVGIRGELAIAAYGEESRIPPDCGEGGGDPAS